MLDLRKKVESILGVTVEGIYSLPVELTDPDGIIYPLSGQVLYDTVKMDMEDGEELIDNNPIVTLRRSSLPRVPVEGEIWGVRIPTVPDREAALESFLLNPDKPLTGGASIGIITLHLQKPEQSP